MGAELVYQRDSYLREIDAVITSIDGDKVYLDRTIFTQEVAVLNTI